MHPQRVMSVRVPETQSTEQAPVMTVTNFRRLEFGLVEYGDERGRQVTTVVAITGGKVYAPPQGEQWTAGFRSFVKQINDQIVERNEEARSTSQGSPTGKIPTEDVVDVTGGGAGMDFGSSDVESVEQKIRKGGR